MSTPVATTECELPDRFTQFELDQFERDGYVIVRKMVEPAIIDEMLCATNEGLERQIGPLEYESELQYPGAPESLEAQGGQTVRRLKQAHSRGIVFTQWLTNPKLVRRLQQILGPTVIMPLAHHNCIMTKQPEYSSDTGWHQDIRYWAFHQSDLVNAWLALGDEFPENGCLKLIPSTHRTEFEPRRLDDQLFLNDKLPENEELIHSSIHAELQAGDVLFFHCRTFHAASRNFTNQPKYSVVFTFHGADNSPQLGTRSASLPEVVIASNG